MRIGPFLFFSTVLMFILYEPHLPDLVVPDPFFGWGAHAACLGFSWWAIGGLTIFNVGIALEFLRIPSRSYLFRKQYKTAISPYGQENLRRLEAFVLLCGMAHIVRPVAAFAPSLTFVVLALDGATLFVSIRARKAMVGMTAEAMVIVKRKKVVEQKFEEIVQDREAVIAERNNALEAMGRLTGHVDELNEISARFTRSSNDLISNAAEFLRSENLAGALVRIVETHPDTVVLYEMSEATIIAASSSFWAMIDREPGRDVEYLPLVAPEIREQIERNGDERPLAQQNVDHYDVVFVGSGGQRINVRHWEGFIEGEELKSISWCRAEQI